ncbi:hypothetical protein B0T24DRAFT_666755 [Lasiosphaeria ovina]|uniref:Uncharacterized protein n=1 Tax=Lasiosphaeria ovina TaxID=92902 RepID=A0AAE0KB25_9PEZI|nr:hypothetical protein B0T24DRAFT_666755 [Lasiosphaeria ovina]
MSGRRAANAALKIVGKVTLDDVKKANGADGNTWVNAIIAAGAAARAKSHIVSSHSNIMSTAFLAGKKRKVSSHVHLNKPPEWSKEFGDDPAEASSYQAEASGSGYAGPTGTPRIPGTLRLPRLL